MQANYLNSHPKQFSAIVMHIKQQYHKADKLSNAIDSTVNEIRTKGKIPSSELNYARLMVFNDAISKDILIAESGIGEENYEDITKLKAKRRALQTELGRQFITRHKELRDLSHPLSRPISAEE